MNGQGQVCNLWGPVQNKNSYPHVKKKIVKNFKIVIAER